MEQARKRLVELLIDADYITSKDSNYSWWKKDVTVGVIKNNYSNYKYLYSINENYDGKKGLFRIDYKSIWSVFEKENNMSYQQVKDYTESALGERFNFGDITTFGHHFEVCWWLGEHCNY